MMIRRLVIPPLKLVWRLLLSPLVLVLGWLMILVVVVVWVIIGEPMEMKGAAE